eukprot:364791-Chlamydomonas_euryale.AAC.11
MKHNATRHNTKHTASSWAREPQLAYPPDHNHAHTHVHPHFQPHAHPPVHPHVDFHIHPKPGALPSAHTPTPTPV